MASRFPEPVRRCSICLDPRKREFVDRRIAEGYSANRIETWSRTPEALEAGMTPVKRETVSAHLDKCLTAQAGTTAGMSAPTVHAAAVMAAKVNVGVADPNDLAVLVRDAVAEKVRAGEVRLTAQHGLTAQAMMDRRNEKKSERELAMAISTMLFASGPPDSVLPPMRVVGEVIDGEAVEV